MQKNCLRKLYSVNVTYNRHGDILQHFFGKIHLFINAFLRMISKLVQQDSLGLNATLNVLYQCTERTVSRCATVVTMSVIMSTDVNEWKKVTFIL